jgi:hypothetical protein
MQPTQGFALGALCALALSACSSSSATKTATDSGVTPHPDAGVDAHQARHPDAGHDTGLVDASPDVPGFVAADGATTVDNDPNDCVAPGTPSNAEGVGGYCSPNGGQCAKGAPDGNVSVCTADFNVPAHAWFCTIACTSSAECGSGSASCLPSVHGQSCVPSACVDVLNGITDSGAGDAPHDASDGG